MRRLRVAPARVGAVEAIGNLQPMRSFSKRLVLPVGLPPAKVEAVPGRGEIFFRHHERPGGPTLLLLHGWTASADLQWFTAYLALSDRYPFVAVDHRGHGRGLRTEEPFTLEDAADDAAALIRHLGVGPVVAVGYSMGGPISILLAERHPDLVAGMVLEATALEWKATFRDRLTWRGLVLLEFFLRSRLSRWAGRRAVRKLASGNPDLEPHVAWLAAEARRGDPADIADAGRSLSKFDARPIAPTLRRPAAVVITTLDRGVRPVKQEALAAALDASRFELAGDHFAFWANPKQFAEVTRLAVDDVVNRLPEVSTPA